MRILIVKTSSMGDIIHTLPGITDITNHIDAEIDWVVEPSFSDIPKMHKGISHVYEVSFRELKKRIFNSNFIKQIKELRKKRYDFIIDAQGLVKSAILSKVLKGKTYGFNFQSIKEPIASLFYDKKFKVDKNLHAIDRVRLLFSKIFQYEIDENYEYQLELNENTDENYLVFLHSTTWESKHWPEKNWKNLSLLAKEYKVLLPWFSKKEYERALRISNDNKNVVVLPIMKLYELSKLIANAKAVISVDTGLGHMASALNVPTIGLYGPTDVKRNGIVGRNQSSLSAKIGCSPCLGRKCKFNREEPPCYKELTAEKVWKLVQEKLGLLEKS